METRHSPVGAAQSKQSVPPLRGFEPGFVFPHRFTVGYDMPSLRDCDRRQIKVLHMIGAQMRAE